MPFIVDNTVRLALPLPAARARRRHRRALGDQVHRRPRHDDGRRDRRVGQVPVGQRQVPGHDRALARLSRRELLRDLRRLRLHMRCAHGDDAHVRPVALAVQRLAAPAGPRDAAAADGPALRERARGREVPVRASAGGVGQLPGPARQQVLRARRRYMPQGASGLLSFGDQGRRRSGREVHRGAHVHEPPRQHRRRQDARDPSGLDDASPAGRGGAGRRPASRRTWSGCRSGSKRSTTSSGTSTSRCTPRRKSRGGDERC